MSFVEGLEDWARQVEALPEEVFKAARGAVKKNADDFEGKLRQNTPEEHGELIQTIKQREGTGQTKTAGDKALSITVSIGDAQHPYAADVEFGHMDKGKHVPAHPFFYPTARVFKKTASRRMIRDVKAILADYSADPVEGGDE